MTTAKIWFIVAMLQVLIPVHLSAPAAFGAQDQNSLPQSSPNQVSDRAVGKVKSVANNVITITTDTGSEVSVQVSDSTRLVKVAPGQKDLKDALPVQLPEVQPGDRILTRGKSPDNGKTLIASSAILMKASDVSAKLERDREDWKQHGVGGLVSSVDPTNRIIAVTMSVLGGNKTMKIVLKPDTILRRYAPDSIKFDDAKPGPLSEIKPGDQLRARGDLGADGAELTAQEVVSGTFRNIAGTVVSTDPSKNTLTVIDLATKKPVVLVVDSDSQMRKLSPMLAQRIAMRIKGGSGESAPPSAVAGAAHPGSEMHAGPNGNARPNSAPDFQQLLSRMPAATLSDLQKGDAVILVSTEGSAGTPPKAVTLVSGVEPILTASPDSGRAAMLLSPWNISTGGGDSAGGANQ